MLSKAKFDLEQGLICSEALILLFNNFKLWNSAHYSYEVIIYICALVQHLLDRMESGDCAITDRQFAWVQL